MFKMVILPNDVRSEDPEHLIHVAMKNTVSRNYTNCCIQVWSAEYTENIYHLIFELIIYECLGKKLNHLPQLNGPPDWLGRLDPYRIFLRNEVI